MFSRATFRETPLINRNCTEHKKSLCWYDIVEEKMSLDEPVIGSLGTGIPGLETNTVRDLIPYPILNPITNRNTVLPIHSVGLQLASGVSMAWLNVYGQ